jgi:hypothetical protein
MESNKRGSSEIRERKIVVVNNKENKNSSFERGHDNKENLPINLVKV